MKRHILLNPFAHFAEIQLVAAGLLATAVGSFLGWQCNTRFDGVLDLHFVSQTTPWQPLLDNGINLLCLVIPLYLVGRSINSKTRLIDLVSTALVARIPYYVLPLTNTGGFMHLASMNLVEMPQKVPLSGWVPWRPTSHSRPWQSWRRSYLFIGYSKGSKRPPTARKIYINGFSVAASCLVK